MSSIKYKEITSDYWQLVEYDEHHRVVEWIDSDGRGERFSYEELGVKKNGDPEYNVHILDSSFKHCPTCRGEHKET